MIKFWLVVTALSGLMGVALGAFGAHGLKGKISESLFSAFQTATYYQLFHTLALLALVILMSQLSVVPKGFVVACFLWMVGIIFFSGSLYILALNGPGWLGPITPFGGLLLMSGWVSLLVGSLRLEL